MQQLPVLRTYVNVASFGLLFHIVCTPSWQRICMGWAHGCRFHFQVLPTTIRASAELRHLSGHASIIRPRPALMGTQERRAGLFERRLGLFHLTYVILPCIYGRLWAASASRTLPCGRHLCGSIQVLATHARGYSTATSSHDVIVIGAGAHGSAATYHLAMAGAKVVSPLCAASLSNTNMSVHAL